MASELLRIPVELGGVPFLGFGVLLAVWLAGFGLLIATLVTRGAEGAWGYAQPAAIGAVLIAIAPRLAPEGIPIRGYGVMLLLAIGTGVAMAIHRARRHGVEADTVIGLVVWLFVAGIAGARAFFVIEYWDVRYAGKPLGETVVDILQFTEGGLVVYGSVIGGLIAFVVFALRNRLPVLGMADILAPCFMAGLAIGRIGCLLNGCCYGGPCELPWAVTFPSESPPFYDQLVRGDLHGLDLVERETPEGGWSLQLERDGQQATVAYINGVPMESRLAVSQALGTAYQLGDGLSLRLANGDTVERPPATRARSLPVHPTQVYSAINAALTAWLLWAWFPHRRRDGEVALAMFTLYPISRFLLEMIRTDEEAIFGTGLSISQNVSLLALAGAGVGWWWLCRQPPGRALVETLPPQAETARTPSVSGA